MGYFLCVAAGLLLASLAARWQPRALELPPAERQWLVLCAIAGAIVGAYGLELPADRLGWTAPPPPGAHGDALPLGGRTVLGGLLGGWIGVELRKLRAGIRTPTGGDFALPLAIALGCGRLGCWSAGCCAGAECAPAWYATIDAAGTARWPVQLGEAAFHFAAAGLLALAAHRRWWPTQRLPAYVAACALLRFVLEFARQHPPVLAGLTWFQWLALALFALAGGTLWRRLGAGRHPPSSRASGAST